MEACDMAKSPLSKASKKTKAVRNQSNVTPLALTIPYKEITQRTQRELDISHLTHRHCDLANEKIESRIQYLRRFSKKAHDHVANGKSVTTVSTCYVKFQSFIQYCDSQNVNPFSVEGYLSYFGNDGEMRHQIKMYSPSTRLWEMSDGNEIGIKESSVKGQWVYISTALEWCGLDAKEWRHLHRHFKSVTTPFEAYSERDELMIVGRLSELFFGLAPQLIALKIDESTVPDSLPVAITFDDKEDIISFPTSLELKNAGKVNYQSAFNVVMGAAYHLICYFTSLNDSVVREICHPLTVETDTRDKSLKTIKITGFKPRANQDVSALMSNEVDESEKVSFDVEKKTGVTFIETLSELSRLYGSDEVLLYTLDKDGAIADAFDLVKLNANLTNTLNLISSKRAMNLPWFSELFYTYQQSKGIELRAKTNAIGRKVVSKSIYPIPQKGVLARSILNISYCILSCFTDAPLKGMLLPLSYSPKDENGHIQVSFSREDDSKGYFEIPATYLKLIKDIEAWATARLNPCCKKKPPYLLRIGVSSQAKQWEGASPIRSNYFTELAVQANDYFVTLQSSRFRETTSYQEYAGGHLAHLKHLLQNTLGTLEKHYVNGHSETNKRILSQAIQVLERIAKGESLSQAKAYVQKKLAIPMLTHDEWLKKKTKTNPNGVSCNGQQALQDGRDTQRATNKTMQQDLPCSEFDMCYKCKSAKAVDEPNAIYKLISFIDVLREALDRFPNAKLEVQKQIAAFEYTLEGASIEVLEEAMQRFNKDGRHPRITMNHALLSIYH